MLETSRIYVAVFRVLRVALASTALALAACAAVEPELGLQKPAVATLPPALPAKPVADPAALAEEARALLAQAETDIQRARSRKALWAKAWEALVGARAANAARDSAGAIREARRASEFAQLGLEQLAYPAVKSSLAEERTVIK